MNDRISVVIASYNGAKYLKEQLDSIYNQSLMLFEVIVTDDGSSDGTLDILEEYSQRYGLKYFVNETQLGVNKNFERALRLTKGDYIMISDQDDVWFDNKTESSYNSIKKLEQSYGTHVPIVFTCQHKKITAQGQEIPSVNSVKDDSCGFRAVMFNSNNNSWQGCTLMLNRALLLELKEIPSEFTQYPYDLFITLFASITGINYSSKEVLFYHRMHGDNVSSYRYGKKKSVKDMLNDFYYTSREFFDSSLYHQRVVKLLFSQYKDKIKDTEILNDIHCVIDYLDGNVFCRIQSVRRMDINNRKRRIKQYLKALLPLKLMQQLKEK